MCTFKIVKWQFILIVRSKARLWELGHQDLGVEWERERCVLLIAPLYGSVGGVILTRGNSEKSVLPCCFVHLKWHMDWRRREPGPLRLETLELFLTFPCVVCESGCHAMDGLAILNGRNGKAIYRMVKRDPWTTLHPTLQHNLYLYMPYIILCNKMFILYHNST
jgi:hypothetical protein